MTATSETPGHHWPAAFWSGLLCLVLSGPGHAATLPPFTASYEVLRNDLTIGTFKVTLTRRSDETFMYESLTRAAGLLSWLFRKDRIREYSLWTFHNDRIRPLEYRYENTGKGAEFTEQLEFDWDSSTARQTARKPAWKIPIPAGALDKVTMNLALMLDLQQQKEDVTYTIPDDAKLRHYRFHAVDRETIYVPAGQFATIKLERIRDQKRASMYLWCAPALRYLPVQIDNRKEDGLVYRSVLLKVSPELQIPLK